MKNNLIYTSRDDDRIETSLLLENLIKYLQLHEVNISEKALLTFFNNILGVFLNDNHVDLSDSSEIVGFKLLNEYDNRASNIVDNWINNHIIIVDNYNEKTLMDDIKEKVLSALYHEGISMVNNDVFIQLPDELKSNFIIESEFHEHIQKALIEKVGSDRIFNNPDGSYVEQIQIMKYKALTEEDLREWINSNLEELLKANVVNKKNIIDNFSRYLKEQNIKNTTQHSIEQLIDAAMKDYYANVSEVTLKLLNDSQNEYYVLVSD
ncbi:MAG: hypothetical protein E7Z85_07750 [Methanosphaera stadtmanae]|nr:hypothetical protein [Methanosphaera stadtmanae]